MRFILRSKIFGATVTESSLEYVGSITIDEELVEAGGFLVGEKVLVSSLTTGARLETYIILGKKGSGAIEMNGPTAHVIKKNEKVVIMGFELSDSPIEARVIKVDERNKII